MTSGTVRKGLTVNTVNASIAGMMSKRALPDIEPHLARDDYTLEELVDTAGRLLSELVPTQSRYKVTERPDARTIRYYVSQGLLPRPVSYEGGRARYAGEHLLRLLVIKKLQAEHHTLARIASVLEDASASELKRELRPGRGGRRPRALKRVSASRLVSRAEGPAAPSTAVRRYPLPGDAAVFVPEDAIRDPRTRAEVADRLEALARTLRDGEKEEDP